MKECGRVSPEEGEPCVMPAHFGKVTRYGQLTSLSVLFQAERGSAAGGLPPVRMDSSASQIALHKVPRSSCVSRLAQSSDTRTPESTQTDSSASMRADERRREPEATAAMIAFISARIPTWLSKGPTATADTDKLAWAPRVRGESSLSLIEIVLAPRSVTSSLACSSSRRGGCPLYQAARTAAAISPQRPRWSGFSLMSPMAR